MRVVESADIRGGPGDSRNRFKVRSLSLSLPDTSSSQLFQMRKKSDLKFSWEDRQAGSHSEDWSVHKVQILSSDYKIFINSIVLLDQDRRI